MFVRMKTHITGTRNGVEWPKIGGMLELPDQEALDLVAAGYAVDAGEMSSEQVRVSMGLPPEEEDDDAETPDHRDEDAKHDGDEEAASNGDTDAEPEREPVVPRGRSRSRAKR